MSVLNQPLRNLVREALRDHRKHSPPATYGHCIAGTENTGSFEDRQQGPNGEPARKQCAAYRCTKNMLVVHHSDVPGRRHLSVGPDGTVAILDPPWTFVANPIAGGPSCVLDEAGKGPQSADRIADVLSMDKRNVELLIKRALTRKGAAVLHRLKSELGDEE